MHRHSQSFFSLSLSLEKETYHKENPTTNIEPIKNLQLSNSNVLGWHSNTSFTVGISATNDVVSTRYYHYNEPDANEEETIEESRGNLVWYVGKRWVREIDLHSNEAFQINGKRDKSEATVKP